MIDPPTMTLIMVAISCIISVMSFVRSGSKGAEAQGRMIEKLDQVYRIVERQTIQISELVKADSQTAEQYIALSALVQRIEERVSAIERKPNP